jgi:hypothetical protein
VNPIFKIQYTEKSKGKHGFFHSLQGLERGQDRQVYLNREIRPDEALVRITHSGLCGTDEHFKHKDMGLGHEGAGVAQVSSQTSNILASVLTTHPGGRP